MGLESAVYNGSFSFTLADSDTTNLLVATSYTPEQGTRYDPQVGHWSYWTQALGNAFPVWHGARRNPIGLTQTFLNHAAIGIEGAVLQALRARRNFFVQTCDGFQPAKSYVIPLTRAPREPGNVPRYNLLVNADFSIPGLVRYGTPAFWSKRGSATTGTVEMYSANALTGSGSVHFTLGTSEEAYLHQHVDGVFGETRDGQQVAELTASIWVLIPRVSTETDATGDLTLTVVYEDGSGEAFQTELPTGTDGGWHRLSVTGRATKRMVSADFQIHVVNGSGGSLEVFVDAAQLESGPTVRPWMPMGDHTPTWWDNIDLSPVYLHAIGPASSITKGAGFASVTYDEYEHVRVWVAKSESDWWLNSLPTRVETMTVDLTDDVAAIRSIWGFEAETDTRERRTTKLSVNTTTNRVDLVDNLVSDVYESYQLAERFLDQDDRLRYAVWEEEDSANFNRTLECLTIHRDRLWVVSQENYLGVDYRVLKICRPHSNSYVLADEDLPNYLEVLQDYNLDISGVDVTGVSCTSIGFVEGNENKVLLTMDGTVYAAPLYYDYAYWSPARELELLARHEYDGYSLVVT